MAFLVLVAALLCLGVALVSVRDWCRHREQEAVYVLVLYLALFALLVEAFVRLWGC